jgi:hypothetical protein
LLIFSNQALGKHKFEINRCVLANGTISFQEKPCQSKPVKANYTKLTQSKNKQKIKKNHRRTSTKDKSTVSSDKVKSLINSSSLIYKNINNANNSGQTDLLISHKVGSYQISITTHKNWLATTKVYSKKLLHMKFIDINPNNRISLLIDFIFPDNKKFTLQELTNLINLVGSRYISGSIENAIHTYKLRVKQGLGVMATFTNSQLIKNYKYATKGVIFKKDWMIQFTLLSDNLNSNSHNWALHSLIDSVSIVK